MEKTQGPELLDSEVNRIRSNQDPVTLPPHCDGIITPMSYGTTKPRDTGGEDEQRENPNRK